MTMIHNKLTPPDLSQVRIQGSVGDLLDRLIERRITSEEARTVIYREAEDAFKNQIDDQTIVGYWQGEFWGKWMISAARVCRYLGDPALREFIRQGAYRLIGYQRDDGYLGTYRDSGNVLACDRAAAQKIVGWPCNWNWNIWCRKYTLWGLIECWQLLDDPKILAAAVCLADHLINELQKNNLRLCDTGTFNGLPSGSIIKPMTILWQVTGNRRYLDFAVEAAEAWDRTDGRIPNLIANARTGRPLHEWYPEPQTWAKAYELMSCLDGLLELYRATGTVKYLTAVEQIRDLLDRDEKNIMGSVGFNDIFAHAAPLINAVSEACDVIHWMRVNYELFAITGQCRYLDTFEEAFYNAFLASVYSDGRWGSRGVRSSGRHVTAYQCNFRHNHCCVNNLPRGFMNMAQAAVMQGDDAIYINLFSELSANLTTADGRSVGVRLDGAYLQEGRSTITVAVGSDEVIPDPLDIDQPPLTLRIRIPGWSKQTTLRTNGQACYPPAGDFYRIDVTSGLTVIDIQFDQTSVLSEFPGEPTVYGPTDFRSQRWTLDPQSNPISYVPYEKMIRQRMSTLRVGPLLLARSKRIGSTEPEMFPAHSLCTPDTVCQVRPRPLPGVRCGFAVTLETSSSHPDGLDPSANAVQFLMCDYASAANDILDDSAYFNIYL